jgi:thiamine-phosphate pyrophosphorylase
MQRLQTKTPLVCLITDGTTSDADFCEKIPELLNLIAVAVKENVTLVQIREKQLSARKIFELTAEAAAITKNSRTKLLVNDRADIALAARADGVHLTSNSISAKTIRQNFPANFIIGVSCHTVSEVSRAKSQSADFAVFSPVFASPDKGEPQGLEKLREVCSVATKDFSVLALGGIDETNFESALEVGASGVAAIRLLNDAEKLSRFAGKARRFTKCV